MRIHVQRTVSRCYVVLRQLRQIRHSVPTDTFQTLVVSLVLTRLDYDNSALAGLPVYLVRRLQSVLNAAAQFTCGDPTTSPTRWPASIGCASQRESSSRSLYWHYKVIHRLAPGYLGPFTRVADLNRRSLRSVGTNRLVVPTSRLSSRLLVAELIRSPARRRRMTSLETFRRLLNSQDTPVQEVFSWYLLDINSDGHRWTSAAEPAHAPSKCSKH